MKQLSTFLLLLAALPAAAQQWSPVSRTDTLNFRLDGETFLPASCFVSGFSAAGGDTTFTYNQVGCDSCLTLPASGAPCISCFGLQHQPQAVTGYTILKTAGDTCTFSGRDQRVLPLQAHTGDSWLFESAAGISAQVLSETAATVLGQPDSVKTALLSSGDTIAWSKAHGILLWPQTFGGGLYYRLAGMNGRDLGEQLPVFGDYFGFGIGQMFQYHYESSNPNLPYYWRDEKYHIVSRQDSGDTIFYQIQGLRHEIYQSGWPGPNNPPVTYTTASGAFTQTIAFKNDPQHIANRWNHTIEDGQYDYINIGWGQDMILQRDTPGVRLFESELFTDTNGIPGIWYNGHTAAASGGFSYAYGNFIFPQSYYGSVLTSAGSDTLYGYYPPESNPAYNTALTLLEHVGVTFLTHGNYFEGGDILELTAFTLNNDTIGHFIPDSQLDAVAENSLGEAALLYPNPASNRVLLRLPSGTAATVQVSDLQGRVMFRENVQDLCAFDCASWAAGVYAVTIYAENSVAVKRLVVRH